jgi:CBS domain-containing protein/anti-sigma regulatory factor (Ser/Thr protein kinase)
MIPEVHMPEAEAPKGILITDKMAEKITRVEELAYEIKIQESMTRYVETLSPETKMGDALDIFRQSRISGAPVMCNNELVGIISIEDLINCLRSSDIDAPVSKYMTTRLVTVKGSDPVVEALKVFVTTRLGRLPVLDENNHMIGIITKGDVTDGILKALQQSYEQEELRRYRASHLFEDIVSDRSSLILRYEIKARDFTQGGAASSKIKRALLRLGANPQVARRVGIAVYEAEINLIIHANDGGVLRVEIEPHQISIEATDQGPGIKDIDLALKPGYSTATEEIRELGFGAGMGLINIARCMDHMQLESTYGVGTKLKMKLFIKEDEGLGEAYPINKEVS